MTLRELIETASRGYEKQCPDSPLTDLVDDEGQPLDPMPEDGDTLAVFLVRELANTFEAGGTDEQQIEDARSVLHQAMAELHSVLDAVDHK